MENLMYKRIIALVCLAVVGLAASARAQAQDQAAMDDQAAMREAMQPMFQTIMQNMNDKGIDPRTFFQQMQNGDPAEMQKQLVAQGLIDQKTIDQVTYNVQTIQSKSLKRQLGATDEQWTTLWPLIQKVMKASATANGSRGQMGGMGMGGFMTSMPAAGNEVSRTRKALDSAIKDPGTGAAEFAAVLKDYRAARAQAQADLDAAKQELVSALTTRQEGVLTTLGIIE
jgi:hypothetical protein